MEKIKINFDSENIMQPPSTTNLLENSARRLRFMRTRKALEKAISVYDSHTSPSNEEIVKLVRQARNASKHVVLDTVDNGKEK